MLIAGASNRPDQLSNFPCKCERLKMKYSGKYLDLKEMKQVDSLGY
jgi:hypothetical protein